MSPACAPLVTSLKGKGIRTQAGRTTWEELPGSGGALRGGEKIGSAQGGTVVAARAQTVSLHQQKVLKEGDPVKELRECHLLLPGGTAELREDRPQT